MGGVAVGTSWALGDYVLKLTFYSLGDLTDPPEVKPREYPTGYPKPCHLALWNTRDSLG